MWHYVFLMLRRQPGKSALASSGFLLAACALILLSATTQATLVRGNQIISQNWRPAYDLVALPPQAKIPSDPRVPSDLLAGYGGGISVQQYEQIKNLPGIEVAAPIAYVGNIQMPTPALYFKLPGFPTGYYQLDYILTAFNGQRQLVETQKTVVVYISSGSDSGPVTDTSSQQLPDILQALGGQLDMVLNETQDTLLGPLDTPAVSTFLLAGIDPQAENQLVHLNKSVQSGRMLTEQDTVHLDPRVPSNPDYNPVMHKSFPYDEIPMLIHRKLPGQIALHLMLTLLYHGAMTPEQIKAKGGIPYLQHLPDKQIIFDGTVPIVQIAGCMIAVVLTFLSVADLLLLQVRERQKEIGLLQAIGWRPWAIQRLFVQEGLFLAIIGTIPGVLVSLWVLSAQHSAQNIVSLPLMACGVIVLMGMVSALAILPAMRTVSHMEVVDLLRAE